MIRAWRCSIALMAVLELFLAPAAAAQTTALLLDSQPGDYIGVGVKKTWTEADGTFSVTRNFYNGVSLSIVGQGYSFWWYLDFTDVNGTPLAVGTYRAARRFPLTKFVGLSVGGSGRGCNELTGWYEVREIVYAADGTIVRFAADFEQHCDDQAPGLFGAIRYHSTIADLVPFGGQYPSYTVAIDAAANGNVSGSGLDCGTGGTACAVTLPGPSSIMLTATSAPGYFFAGWTTDCRGSAVTSLHVNGPKRCAAVFEPLVTAALRTLVVLDSQAGDTVGQGQRLVYGPANSLIKVSKYSDNALIVTIDSISATRGESWSITFAPPSGETLQAKTYTGASGIDMFPLAPGLTIDHGNYCSNLSGRFVIQELTYAPDGSVARLSADFEQHCNDAAAGLFAAVRYNSSVNEPEPFASQYPIYRLSMTPPANGSVSGGGLTCGLSGSVCDVQFGAAAHVTLTPTPASGYLFSGWTGDCFGPVILTFHVNGTRACGAVFEPVLAAGPRTLILSDSQPGDTVGLGRKDVFSSVNSIINISTIGVADLMVSLTTRDESGRSDWSLQFGARTGDVLRTGTRYGGTIGGSSYYGTHPAPYLYLSANGHDCPTATGRFVIDELAFNSDGTVARLAADFEQHCDDAAAGLFLSVRYNSSAADPTPFGGLYPVYSVTFTPPSNGAVSGAGLACGTNGSACLLSLTEATRIALSATPSSGYLFAGWSGDCHGTVTLLSLHVNGPKQCTAAFVPIATTEPRTLVVWDSQSGDTVGQGRKEAYSDANSIIAVRPYYSSNGVNVTIASAEGPLSFEWSIEMRARAGDVLEPGHEYKGATRALSGAVTPYLEVTGNSRYCGSVTGWFVIHQIAYAIDGTILQLSADLEHHCDNAAPALFIAIRFNATVGDATPFAGQYPSYGLSIAVPAHGAVSGGPINCGSGGSACQATLGGATRLTLTATAENGYVFTGWTGDCRGEPTISLFVNGPKQCGTEFQPIVPTSARSILFLDSQPGDVAGGGKTIVLAPISSSWSVYGSTNYASFDIQQLNENGSSSSWSVLMGVPYGQTLKVGTTYTAVGWSSGSNPVLSAHGTYCSSSIGRFVILEIAYSTSGALSRLAADFEQHCDGADEGLFGAVRYNSTIALTPFGGDYPKYQLTISPPTNGRVVGSGIDCGGAGSVCQVDLTSPAAVSLIAVPDAGYMFAAWNGPCHGGSAMSTRVNMVRTCGVRFEPSAQSSARTLLVVNSEPGEYLGEGRQEVYSAWESSWSVSGSGQSLNVTVLGWGDKGESWWAIWLGPPTGETLEVGKKYAITSTSSSSSAPTLHVYTSSRSCSDLGSFVVRELVRTSDGRIGQLAVDIDHRCGTLTSPALTISLKYNSVVDVVPQSTMSPDKTTLVFAAINNGSAQTGNQIVRLKQSGPRLVGWKAVPGQPWITVTPTEGEGPATLTIGIRFTAGLPVVGTVLSTVSFVLTDAAAESPPVSVTLNLMGAGLGAAPIGVVDTPPDGATGVTGSIAVTGWALDDVEVVRVRIVRDAVAGEGTDRVFIGNATFVDGSRPDVASAYSTAPRSTRAGWGYLLLTNFLPNRGTGTFRLDAYADDADGHTTVLGSRTITCTNNAATLPFGAIDTPDQGEVISGTTFANFGWVLAHGTRRADPPGGGTVRVLIDGVAVGSPGAWGSRSDLIALFPVAQFAGVGTALGVFGMNLTVLADGMHTIAWVVTDDAGNTEGIGSRFFTVANSAVSVGSGFQGSGVQGSGFEGSSVRLEAPALMVPARASTVALREVVNAAPQSQSSIAARRGFDLTTPFRWLGVGASGRTTIQGEELDRIEVQLGGSEYTGYMRVGDDLGPLPIGSQLDGATGVFTWGVGVGFIHDYDLVFVRWANGRAVGRQEVRITLGPKQSNRVGPQVVIDTPASAPPSPRLRRGLAVALRAEADEATAGKPVSVGRSFLVGGWAADLDETVGTGVDTLHVWAYQTSGGDPIFLGATAYGGVRPDVGAIFGDQFRNSGYGLVVDSLPPGTYDLAVFAWSTVQQGFVPARVVRVTVR